MHDAILSVKVVAISVTSKRLVYLFIYSVVTALNTRLLSNTFLSAQHHVVKTQLCKTDV